MKLMTATPMLIVETSCRVCTVGERLVPPATAMDSPAAMPAALVTQPSRASARHRGRRCGQRSPIVMHPA